MQQFKLHLNLARLINNKTDAWTRPLTGLVAPAAVLQLHPQNLSQLFQLLRALHQALDPTGQSAARCQVDGAHLPAVCQYFFYRLIRNRRPAQI